jgi:integrase/recombinase XerD
MNKDSAAPSPSLEHAAAFLASLGGSQRTAETYRQALRRLAECLQATEYGGPRNTFSPYPAADLGDDVLMHFYRWLQARDYRPRTLSVYLAAVRRFLVWLDAHDYLAPGFSVTKAQNRLKAVRGRVRRPSDVARPVDPDLPQIVTYYDRVPLPDQGAKRLRLLRDRAVVHVLYSSAGRVSEVASLTRADVLDGRLDEVLIRGKGGRDRVILLTPEAQRAIAAYCRARTDRYPGLFISHGRNRGKPLGRWALWKVVKDAAKALGLYRGTSPHDFRHFRARQLLHEGMDLDVLQVYLGHADVATTRRIYAPFTSLEKVKDQLATYGRSPAEAGDSQR